MHGGGTGQFASIPLNLCEKLKADGEIADYVVTGSWSDKAAKEADKYVKVNRVLPKTNQYNEIPDISQWKLDPNAKYLFYTDNETIHGIEYPHIPASLPDIPVAVDMTSNFLTRPIDVDKFGVIVAGTQKNVGIAGLAIAIVRQDLIGKAMKICPSILDWKVMDDNKSLYNTPPTFAYVF
jgi:phosphoserine aminotransferase